MSKVLVIDDDPMILRMAGFILKKGGHEALTAASGKDGIEAVKSSAPDVVFIDNEMPEMSGLEVLEALRSVGAPAGLRACIMTGTLTEEIKEKAGSLGAVGCVEKPLNAAEMLALIGGTSNGV